MSNLPRNCSRASRSRKGVGVLTIPFNARWRSRSFRTAAGEKCSKRNGSLPWRVCDREKGFGRLLLHPGIVCIARHLRQSFEGGRTRGDHAQSVHPQVGESLALVGEINIRLPHEGGHMRLVNCHLKYTTDESLTEARFISCPFQQAWKCVRP